MTVSDRVEQLHAAIEAGVAALVGGDDWQRWLQIQARFPRYRTGAVGVFELRECPSVEMGPVLAATRDLPTGGR